MLIEQSPLDHAVVDSLRELQPPDGSNFLAQLVAAFVEDAHARLGELQRAVTADDHGTVRRVAHSLKGMCGAIGAAQMAALSAELERSAVEARVDRQLATRIDGEFARVATALQALA